MIHVGNLSQLLAGPKPERADQIPAVAGRHRRFVAPVPADRDPHTRARCLIAVADDVDGMPVVGCPKCDPDTYPQVAAHRAAGEAVTP